jgi:hypothetical protein
MKKLLAILLVTILVSPAWGALLVYDGFDYTAGERVLGQSNAFTGTNWLFAGAAGANGDSTAINVAAGSLTSPTGMPPAGGNSAAITGVGNLSGTSNRLAFDSAGTPVTSGTVYYSFVLRVDALTGSNSTNGGFFIGLNNTGNATGGSPTTVAARLSARIDPADGAKYDLGIFNNRNPVSASPTWSSALTVGETIFVVASYTINAGASNDVSSLWINPGDLGAESAPPATLTDTTFATTDVDAIRSLILRQSPAPYLTLDELRVGTTWASVTPEPSAICLLGFGAIGLLRRRRVRAAS